jgi:hypothetical protein
MQMRIANPPLSNRSVKAFNVLGADDIAVPQLAPGFSFRGVFSSHCRGRAVFPFREASRTGRRDVAPTAAGQAARAEAQINEACILLPRALPNVILA